MIILTYEDKGKSETFVVTDKKALDVKVEKSDLPKNIKKIVEGYLLLNS